MWPCRAVFNLHCVCSWPNSVLTYAPSWWDFLLRDLVLSFPSCPLTSLGGRHLLSASSPQAPSPQALDAWRGLLLLSPSLHLFWGLLQHIILLAGNVGIHLPQRGFGHLLWFRRDLNCSYKDFPSSVFLRHWMLAASLVRTRWSCCRRTCPVARRPLGAASALRPGVSRCAQGCLRGSPAVCAVGICTRAVHAPEKLCPHGSLCRSVHKPSLICQTSKRHKHHLASLYV